MTIRSKILIAVIFGLLGLGCFGGALSSFMSGGRDGRELAVILVCFGGVSVIISTSVFASAFRRKEASACPKCYSTQRTQPSRQEKQASGMFRVFSLQKCASCGHLWEPPAPRWLLFVGIVAGLWFIIVGVISLSGAFSPKGRPVTDIGDTTVVAIVFFMIGGAAMAGCIRRLERNSRPTDLVDGQGDAYSDDVSATTTCPSCRAMIPPADSSECPQCRRGLF